MADGQLDGFDVRIKSLEAQVQAKMMNIQRIEGKLQKNQHKLFNGGFSEPGLESDKKEVTGGLDTYDAIRLLQETHTGAPDHHFSSEISPIAYQSKQLKADLSRPSFIDQTYGANLRNTTKDLSSTSKDLTQTSLSNCYLNQEL